MLSASTNEVNERARVLLKFLVERYIRDGSPVASRALARAGVLSLSAASIRNVMADLDEMGFVRSPHTSAGRVPTVRGYRYFIDTLLTPQPLDAAEEAHIRSQLLECAGSDQDLLQSASDLLSSLTRMAAVVTVPRRDHVALRQIEFLPLSGGRVLAILVVNQHEVQNRVLHTHRDYSAAELERAANYLNAVFAGKDLFSVREALLRDVQATRAHVNRALLEMLVLGGQLFPDAEQDDFVLAGGTNLMGFQELSNVDRLRGLFEAFDRKQDILRLFDQCLEADGVQIFVGDESGYQALDECSVVTAPYMVDGCVAGVLGVIGPTRMAYSRIISLVDTTARVLGAALNSGD